jgi:transposase InsO family protein
VAEEAHVRTLERICAVLGNESCPQTSRGWNAQRQRRELEEQVRWAALEFRHWTAAQGLSRLETAAHLHLSAHTLRHWEYDHEQPLTLVARGRPVERSRREARNAVLQWITEVGPAIGLASLQGQFPQMARAELQDLLGRYRRVWVKRQQRWQSVLHWQQPGTVWAMDFAYAPTAIDGLYPYALAVRDLASGQQLLWEPFADMTAQALIGALTRLFTMHGAPLVLKSDNGSAFRAAETKQLLRQWQVSPLFSPPGLPAYNGSCEAGIGSLTKRTEYQALLHARPGLWAIRDLEVARHQANTVLRPWGANGPTHEEVWDQRRLLSAETRTAFGTTRQRFEQEARLEGGIPAEADLDHYAQAAIDRKATCRALVAHGFLLFTRRRIPLPI